MQIWWRLKAFVKHRIRNASKVVTLALFFDVVVLISIGVDLSRGLRLYREEANTGKKCDTINIMHRCAIKHVDMAF
jgi:hypothetical protein